MESVKIRLEREQALSFLEFNYMVCQAYDFVELNKRYGCRLQSCGSDQWGNVVSGIDLGRRVENVQLFGLTTPLITTSSGAKMGKSVSGAVWLNADMRSPYDYWQFWRNTEDGDVGRFLRLFTDMKLDEIAAARKAPGRRAATRRRRSSRLKRPAIVQWTRCRGGSGRNRAAHIRGRRVRRRIAHIRNRARRSSPKRHARSPISRRWRGSRQLLRRARRLIQGGGLRINDEVVTDVKAASAAALDPSHRRTRDQTLRRPQESTRWSSRI